MPVEPFDDVLLVLAPDDDVAVAKRAIPAGLRCVVAAGPIESRDAVPAGHKIALRPIERGAPVKKYGQVIGFATRSIGAGEHVHTHNIGMGELRLNYEFGGYGLKPALNRLACEPLERGGDGLKPALRTTSDRTFAGYLRHDGRVGTRNYLVALPTVNCSASACRHVAERLNTADFRRDFPYVDGVIALTHKGGCTLQPGEPHQLLTRVLAGFARHPNVAGYVMIGLGCEGNYVEYVQREHGLTVLRDGELPPAFMNVQDMGGTRKTVEAGVAAVHKLAARANESRRSPQPISKLILALNCGGSDGNSGITANPALGVASDELVRHGGTSVLAETPEIYGAEHLLTRRAVSRNVGEKLLGFIRWWEKHAALFGGTIDNNPSPGNKAGGLTTIYEKSLGAVAKGGQSPLNAVYAYAEKITASGFCFMDTPGYDPVSMTGLIAGGCNIGCFTTGRGSVYGCKPSPCIKIATNTPMYERMADDMDINAGTILEGKESIQQVGMRIFEMMIQVAGGRKTRSEELGIGDEEFAPWPIGPTF